MTHDVGSCVYLTDAHRVRRLEYHLERQHRDPVDGPDDGGLGALPEVQRARARLERERPPPALSRSGDSETAERQECKDASFVRIASR